jgi:hypothetical protein
MTDHAFALDLEPINHSSPEHALWCAALALMLDDARRYHQGKADTFGAPSGTGRRALRDVLDSGPILRRLCEFADVDAAWVSEQFARSLR